MRVADRCGVLALFADKSLFSVLSSEAEVVAGEWKEIM